MKKKNKIAEQLQKEMKKCAGLPDERHEALLSYPDLLRKACVKSGRYQIYFIHGGEGHFNRAAPINRQWVRLYLNSEHFNYVHMREVQINQILWIEENPLFWGNEYNPPWRVEGYNRTKL